MFMLCAPARLHAAPVLFFFPVRPGECPAQLRAAPLMLGNKLVLPNFASDELRTNHFWKKKRRNHRLHEIL